MLLSLTCACAPGTLVAHRSIGASVAEIVIDPEVPEAVRRELEQASLSALVGFSDPLPGQDPPGDEDDAGPVRRPRRGSRPAPSSG